MRLRRREIPQQRREVYAAFDTSRAKPIAYRSQTALAVFHTSSNSLIRGATIRDASSTMSRSNSLLFRSTSDITLPPAYASSALCSFALIRHEIPFPPKGFMFCRPQLSGTNRGVGLWMSCRYDATSDVVLTSSHLPVISVTEDSSVLSWRSRGERRATKQRHRQPNSDRSALSSEPRPGQVRWS